MTACILALSLSACQKPGANESAAASDQPATAPPIAALPLATTPAAPIAFAPSATALPPVAKPIHVGLSHDRTRYGYTDRAYAMNRAFGDTPPDYTVSYDGTSPWVWRSDDGSYRVVEQLPGGQRTYYYERGADRPFYITDPDGGYAYDGDNLVGLYGPDGAPLSDSYAQQRAANAARYYDRSRAIYHAAQYSQRQAANAGDWQARRENLFQQQQRWNAARSRDSDWQTWHDQHQQGESATWQAEQDRRAAYAVAIGAAVVGTAIMTSGNHSGDNHYSGDRQNQYAPSAGQRPNDAARAPAPLPAAPNRAPGYGQRPNANPQPSRIQQQPTPAVQHTGDRPVATQPRQGAFANRPQPQRQNQPRPAAPLPTHTLPAHSAAAAEIHPNPHATAPMPAPDRGPQAQPGHSNTDKHKTPNDNAASHRDPPHAQPTPAPQPHN